MKMKHQRGERAEGTGTDCIRNMRGLCLAELAIGMAIAILILGGLFEVLHLAHITIGNKQSTIAQQQDLRLGLEVFEQEVRLATADSFVSASEHTVEFHANLHALRTNITATVLPGQSILPVVQGSGWGRGKTVVICKPVICETHRLSHNGQRSQLMLDDQLREVFPAGASVELINRVVYYTKEDKKGGLSLMRMVDGGANVLIGEMEEVKFSYRDQKGRVANVPSEVSRVLVEMTLPYRVKKITHSVALRS